MTTPMLGSRTPNAHITRFTKRGNTRSRPWTTYERRIAKRAEAAAFLAAAVEAIAGDTPEPVVLTVADVLAGDYYAEYLDDLLYDDALAAFEHEAVEPDSPGWEIAGFGTDLDFEGWRGFSIQTIR